VLVTNQISTQFQSDAAAVPVVAPPDGQSVQPTTVLRTQTGGAAVAALGNTWSHSVNSRLLLEYVPDTAARRVRIAKSPLVGAASLYYEIGVEGPVAVPRPGAPAALAAVADDDDDVSRAGMPDPYDDDVAVGLYHGTVAADLAAAEAAWLDADADHDAWLG
jgi:hypothetical protein